MLYKVWSLCKQKVRKYRHWKIKKLWPNGVIARKVTETLNPLDVVLVGA